MNWPLPSPLGPPLRPLSSSQDTEAQSPPGSMPPTDIPPPPRQVLSLILALPPAGHRKVPQQRPLKAGKCRTPLPRKSQHHPGTCPSHLRMGWAQWKEPSLTPACQLPAGAPGLCAGQCPCPVPQLGQASSEPLPSLSPLPLPATHICLHGTFC